MLNMLMAQGFACIAKVTMGQVQVNCKQCSRHVQEASAPLQGQQDPGRLAG